MLVPPDNFGMVEPGIYRCSKLEAGHFPFLETLQLKSLVMLDAAKPPRTLKTFLDSNNVELFNLGAMKISNHQNTEGLSKGSASEQSDNLDTTVPRLSKDEIEIVLLDHKKRNDLWMIIERNVIVAAFDILLNKSKHNLLLVDSSLTLVGILRKVQKWNFHLIVNEYRIYTGNASKNNYAVEVFLELIQTELIPYEVELIMKRKDEISLESLVSKSHRPLQHSRTSFDEGPLTGDEDDTVSLEDYEEDMDDDILSASPQIPANLLKLVEQRKSDEKASPGTSPDFRRGIPMSRKGSVDTVLSLHQRRKSSVDSRYIQKNNTRFRNPSFSLPVSPGQRALFELSLRMFRLDKERNVSEELLKLRERYNFKYYKPSANGVHMPGQDVIKLRLPPEHNLPDWFLSGRNFWEKANGL